MENRKIPCPSCRAEIEVDARGDLAGEDIGHFSLHDPTPEPAEAPETPATPAAPAPPTETTPEPVKTPWQARLAEALED